MTLIRLGLGLEGHWLLFQINHRTNCTLITLHLSDPQTKSPPPKSILAQFGPVKWQNLSTAPDERVDHLRSAAVESDLLQNRPGTNFPIEKYELVTLIRLGLGSEGRWLPFEINHRTNSTLITLHLSTLRPNLLPQSEFLPNLDQSSGKNYLQLLTNV